MRQNICKNQVCKLWCSDFPNNCRVMCEIKGCRILKGQMKPETKKNRNWVTEWLTSRNARTGTTARKRMIATGTRRPGENICNHGASFTLKHRGCAFINVKPNKKRRLKNEMFWRFSDVQK